MCDIFGIKRRERQQTLAAQEMQQRLCELGEHFIEVQVISRQALDELEAREREAERIRRLLPYC